MNPVLSSILESGEVIAEDGKHYPVHSQIPIANGEFINRMVKATQPKTSLEIGLAYGISAMFICDALAECGAQRHIVIDPLQKGESKSLEYTFEESDDRWESLEWSAKKGWRGIGLHNLSRAGHAGLLDFRGEPGHLALPKLVEAEEKIEFAFIDGWHTFDYVLLDFFYVDLLLQPGGVVVFDDSNYPAIRKVLRYILKNRHYEVVEEQRCEPARASWRRSLVQGVAQRVPSLKAKLSPETLWRDSDIGLPPGRCIALRKLSDDVLGDGKGETRSWNFHQAF